MSTFHKATDYGFRHSPRPSGAKASSTAGFTLIELLVVTGIMVLISGLVFANNNSFGGKVQLENLAYDIALTIRQAQVYGISVQRFSTDTFASAYGTHFQLNTNLATRDDFTLFADVIPPPGGRSGIYDCTDPTAGPSACELVTAQELQSGYRISDLCIPKTQTPPCGHASLDITFQRPNPDAFIRADGQSTVYESARLQVASPYHHTK